MTRRLWRPITPWLSLGLCSGLAGMVAGITLAGAEPSAAGAVPSQQKVSWHERGRRVYNARCYFCHGYAGDGRTVAATFLEPSPRDFTALVPADLERATMLAAVRDGRPGTAMQGFGALLDGADMQAVVDFVREEFMLRKARRARYHSPVNGWKGEPLASPAVPFVTGALSQDAAWGSLSDQQRTGKRVFFAACIVCHTRGENAGRRVVWRAQALSNGQAFDMDAGHPHEDDYADPPFGLHDQAPRLAGPNATTRRGEVLYRSNCAFCHAADGSGRNWIGSFLEPAPPDFTRPDAMPPTLSAAELRERVLRGVPGTSMPAWGGILSEDQIQAVVTYLSVAFPAFRASRLSGD